jgi:WD40 repeat protein
MAFSPDGSLVATGRSDGTVRLFEASTGEQRLVLPGNACEITDVAFSADGAEARLWGTQTFGSGP